MKLANKKSSTSFIFLGTGAVVAILSVWVFFELGDTILADERFRFDTLVNGWVDQWTTPAVLQWMTILTEFGSVLWLTIVTIAVAIWLYLKNESVTAIVFFGLACASGGLLNSLLKQVFQRERPIILETVDGTGYSFPSGHAMGACIIYGLSAYVIQRQMKNTVSKVVLIVCTILLVTIVGLSRIFLDVHYPTDILAGFSAGLVWVLTALSIMEWRRSVRRRRQLLSSYS
ncbi:phosphatase PAP2 family protein [Bacillaceae bacterium SIJ1]|uniref:phosphatase PAP2 family protein n=1 Tax=Litoribacterium kuwaitense TaxID=1398745 RepID=UPI0013EBE155|nr:phosphatase PAP2 family protein [Litoribacterium kuwaitense]NGP46349.1 phosphatase PAP2 family protein [Litoribacterium kuwaitense]